MMRFVSIALCGLALGWLVGLSVSPVVQYVITALLSILVAYLAVKDGEVTPALTASKIYPLLCALFGIVGGSVLGVRARTHDWLGYDTRTKEAAFWAAHTGLGEKTVYQQMFEHQYAQQGKDAPQKNDAQPEDTSGHLGVLHATPSVDECSRLRKAKGQELVREVAAVKEDKISALADKVTSPALEYIVDEILCPPK